VKRRERRAPEVGSVTLSQWAKATDEPVREDARSASPLLCPHATSRNAWLKTSFLFRPILYTIPAIPGVCWMNTS